MVDKSYGNVRDEPSFPTNPSYEGNSVAKPFIKLELEDLYLLTIAPFDSSHQGKAWAFYIKGNLQVNETIQAEPVSVHNSYFSISVPPPVVDLGNTPPEVRNKVTKLNAYMD